jgi:hypothetical protein
LILQCAPRAVAALAHDFAQLKRRDDLGLHALDRRQEVRGRFARAIENDVVTVDGECDPGRFRLAHEVVDGHMRMVRRTALVGGFSSSDPLRRRAACFSSVATRSPHNRQIKPWTTA